MGKRYSKDVKEEVLGKVRGGRGVADVAREHGINDMTVRTWLERDTVSGGSQILEMSRLKRENEELLRIIGELKVESERVKKKTRRGRR